MVARGAPAITWFRICYFDVAYSFSRLSENELNASDSSR